MPKGSNQKLKLTYLIKIMSEYTDEEHGLSMPDIIGKLQEYDISAERKSIYADFADMTNKLGLDIIKEQIGKETYYKLVNRDFELAEVKLLIDAIQSSKFITEKKSKSLINKIKALLSKRQASKLQRQVYVQGRLKAMNESIYYNVDYIHTAIDQNKKIKFKYYKWDINKELVERHKGTEIVVSPLALIWDDENYYLVAFDEESNICKHYRVDKMMYITILDSSRVGEEYLKDIDIATYSKSIFRMFNGEKTRVKIRFSNDICGIFLDKFGKDINFFKIDDNNSELNVEVVISPQFYAWIFSLGKDVKLVSPKKVVDEFKESLKGCIDNY